MFLARIRTDNGIVVAARVAPGTLVRLDSLVPHAPDDPLALLAELETAELQRRTLALAESGATPPRRRRRVRAAGRPLREAGVRRAELRRARAGGRPHASRGADHLLQAGDVADRPQPDGGLPHALDEARLRGRARRRDRQHARGTSTSRGWEDVVAGYTIFNDVTARDLQLSAIAANSPWDRSKGFDTFAPLGPYLVTRRRDPGSAGPRSRIPDRRHRAAALEHTPHDLPAAAS